ncbi:YafY family protein [Crossiella cryophila]
MSVLSARPSWTNHELAERLDVTERTVRRDIAKLRELGYGIESGAGPWGGYRLRRDSALPPLNLDDEEALAVAVALRETALTGTLGSDQAALSALLKLQGLLPRHIASRLAEFDAAVEQTPRAGEDPVSSKVLLELAGACRGEVRIGLSYRDRLDRASVREVDPYRLVRTRNRWYLVAMDVVRGQWRTFRADRVTGVERTGAPTAISDPPDAARLVAEMLTSNYPVYATVRLAVPLHRARQLVPPGAGLHEPDGPDVTVITLGGNDLDELVTRLLRLATPVRVLAPAELRDAFRARLAALLVEEPSG